MISEDRIAIVATSHGKMGELDEATGIWLEELTTPFYAFVDAGYPVDVYSIAGGTIPIDPRSMMPRGDNEASVERYLSDEDVQIAFKSTLPVETLNITSYRAVLLPGGHGTMFDYPTSSQLAETIATAMSADMIVAALCHGVAGLVAAKYPSGRSVVAGRRVTSFTDSEEAAAGLTRTVPFLLEARLRALGADFKSGPDFQPFALRDGALITGQNPASAGDVARLVIEALRDRGEPQA
jgi:putative intracellular protease/amidase